MLGAASSAIVPSGSSSPTRAELAIDMNVTSLTPEIVAKFGDEAQPLQRTEEFRPQPEGSPVGWRPAGRAPCSTRERGHPDHHPAAVARLAAACAGGSLSQWRDRLLPGRRGSRRRQDPTRADARPPGACGWTSTAVAIVCPTAPLTHQWAIAAARSAWSPPRRPSPKPPGAFTASRSPTLGSPGLRGAAPPRSASGRSSSPTRSITSATSSPGASGFTQAFGKAGRGPAALRHAVPPRRRADPRDRLRQRRLRAARRLLLLRGGDPRRRLPADGLRPLRRHARLAERRDVIESSFERSSGPRAGPPLPHGDLHRPARGAAADPPPGRRAAHPRRARRPSRRRRARRRRRQRARPGGRRVPC